MATYISDMDMEVIEEQLRALEDSELLDFWEQTQALAMSSDPHTAFDDAAGPEYEAMVLRELQLRSSRRLLSGF